MKFGCQLPQDDPDIDHIFEVAKECESLGYDSVWAYDHLSPYWLRSPSSLETWTLLSAIAARTSHIKIGSLVTNVALRNPALLAKMTSTVDRISGGRLIVGLGIGDRMSVRELQAYGFRFPTLRKRLTLLRESIAALKALWTGKNVSVKGQMVSVSNAICLPTPTQEPHPPIWVGGKHHGVIDVAVESADGWNYWGLSEQESRNRMGYFTTKCAQLHRDPRGLTLSWAGSPLPLRPNRIDVQSVRTQLAAQAKIGIDYFIASFPAKTNRKTYQAFAETVRSLS
jgi:alkanesulfonate monooxygenase SsuD/methylene tetrahydromethanopterin reductase-like flavin-dependent oxidoreductase (luciferase family)